MKVAVKESSFAAPKIVEHCILLIGVSKDKDDQQGEWHWKARIVFDFGATIGQR